MNFLAAAKRHLKQTPAVAGMASVIGGSPMLQQWYAKDPYKVRGDIHVVEDPSLPPQEGRAFTNTGELNISLNPQISPSQFYHEVGHTFDQANLNDAARRHFMAIMHYTDPRGWGEQGAASTGYPNPPREQFAEAYRTLTQHPWAASRKGFKRLTNYESDGLGSNTAVEGYNFKPSFYQLLKIKALLQQYAASTPPTP